MQSDHPAESRAPADVGAARLVFADHLRAALVILVVIHHLSIVYAANSPSAYMEAAPVAGGGGALLVVFQLLNQAYFMGALFLLSGYFSPASYDRKGAASFLRDRLVRLGIPLLVYTFVFGPLAAMGTSQLRASLTGITTPFGWDQYPTLVTAGPLWFLEMLLVFDFGYAVWRWATRDRAPLIPAWLNSPGYLAIGAFVLVLAATSFLIRTVDPVGAYVLNFPTLAYLPQYLSFFVIGVIASRRDGFRAIPSRMGKVGFAAAFVATIVLFVPALGGKANFVGGWNPQAAAYALWDSIFSVGMVLGLIVLFRSRFDRPSRLGSFLSRQSFAVYVIHAPLIVPVALLLRQIALPPLLKWGLASIIFVPLCFAVAYLIRKLPFASRIL
jgi:glucans biosynthesis protein C